MKDLSAKFPKIDYTSLGEKKKYTTRKHVGFERQKIDRPEATYSNIQREDRINQILSLP